MSELVSHSAGRQAGDRLPSDAMVSATITFVEWSQGGIPLEAALEQIVRAVGARAGALCRVWPDKDKIRTAAHLDIRSSGSFGAYHCFAHELMGDAVRSGKTGAAITLSQLVPSKSERSPQLVTWMARQKFLDLAFIYLRKSEMEIDILELCFPEMAGPELIRRIEWCGQQFAHIYQRRRMGLVTEALARQSVQLIKRIKITEPILGPDNPTGLTRAEWRVCLLVSRGLAAKAIGRELEISPSTVRTHLKRIYSKTDLPSYYSLARRLVSPEERNAIYGEASRRLA